MSQDMLEACRFYLEGVSKKSFFISPKKLNYVRKTRDSDEAVWKFQDFSVTQILREIKFGQFKSTKTVVFAILEALNLVDL